MTFTSGGGYVTAAEAAAILGVGLTRVYDALLRGDGPLEWCEIPSPRDRGPRMVRALRKSDVLALKEARAERRSAEEHAMRVYAEKLNRFPGRSGLFTSSSGATDHSEESLRGLARPMKLIKVVPERACDLGHGIAWYTFLVEINAEAVHKLPARLRPRGTLPQRAVLAIPLCRDCSELVDFTAAQPWGIFKSDAMGETAQQTVSRMMGMAR